MAKSNVTDLNNARERAAERLLGKLTECDALAQDTSAAIIAITSGARQMLAAPEADALTQVYRLLGAIETYAGELATLAVIVPDPPASGTVPEREAERLRGKLTECDALAQGASATIIAMSRAARQMLAPEADALTQVYHLLGAIATHASELENCINATAENEGANWVDKDKRAFIAKLWEQHHALRSTGALEKRNV